jgi:hypothetical protein
MRSENGPICIPEECSECANLWSKYESMTLAHARVHNQLQIAEHLRDSVTVRHLELEGHGISVSKNSARAALTRHQDAAHQFSDAA